MPADLPGAISSENPNLPNSSSQSGGGGFNKKIILLLALLVLIIFTVIFFVIKKFVDNGGNQTINNNEQQEENQEGDNTPYLGQLELERIDENGNGENYYQGDENSLAIEKISFSDYYEKIEENIQPSFLDYQLPINVKIDVLNYYDVSRKINLDPVIENLNQDGFALIKNPWSAYDKDFYSIYDSLKEYQIPILITSDFLVYNYQNSIKTAFKEIEKSIFFENLFEVSEQMFKSAKNRYEARLSEVGNINDSILEASRLETVYFAVALELLKPTDSQIIKSSIKSSSEKFSQVEADRFTIKIPDYLKAEVEAEVNNIREGKKTEKSPVLLYEIDYKNFVVPSDYRNNEKLNNFYLTTKWLNSVFPLYYKNYDCLDCGLDKEDWQINVISAAMIADDFYSLPELKNKWARIYKILSFFKGLKDDLSYIDYYHALINKFGEDYDINELFTRTNPEFDNNIINYTNEIGSYKFLESQGAIDRSNPEEKNRIGLRLLAESFSPDDHIFKKLTYPETSIYLDSEIKDNNITSCRVGRNVVRCSGSSYDIINLIYPLNENPYFIENSNYESYLEMSNSLKSGVNLSIDKKSSNYWSTLSYIKEYLENDSKYLPAYAKTDSYKQRLLNTSSASWANLQLPMDIYSLSSENTSNTPSGGLGSFSRFSENYYVESNLSLINELLAQNKMVIEMFKALNINNEVRSAVIELENTYTKLGKMKEIIVKQIEGKELSSSDYEDISSFASRAEENLSADDKFKISWDFLSRKELNVDIDSFNLLLLINKNEDGIFFSVGPVWNYQEK